MSTRTPSSLNWLINKRARLNGKILRAKKALEEAQRLGAELSKLQADLEAIDRALGMHEVTVEPDNIRPISVQRSRVALPYGELTKTLLLYLRSNPGKPFSTDELAKMVIEKFPALQEKMQSVIEVRLLRESAGKRLKILAAEKVITRLTDLPGSVYAQWIIPLN